MKGFFYFPSLPSLPFHLLSSPFLPRSFPSPPLHLEVGFLNQLGVWECCKLPQMAVTGGNHFEYSEVHVLQ